MKTLKFEPHLIPLILNGQKTSTWRLFDDKDLNAGDRIDFINSETKEKFATAELTRIIEKPFSELTYDDKQGHEQYSTDEDMYQNFSRIYNTEVKPDTEVKIAWFKLL